MKRLFFALTGILFLAITSAAHASVACSAIPSADGTDRIYLYYDPSDISEIMREISQDDLVLYPDAEMAPKQVEGWVWMRYDDTQEDIWQGGVFGWVKVENIADCG